MNVTLRSLLALLFLLPVAGVAQQSNGDELVDRIVAVVGDSIILRTEVQSYLIQLEAQGVPVAPEGSAERGEWEEEALNDLINQLLLVQAASRDTLVTVSEDRVEAALRQTWEQQIQAFTSEARLRQAIEDRGQTVTQYRAELRNDIRRSLLVEGYFALRAQQARGLPPVEESEIREFFERERGRLGRRPATLTFQQAFIFPSPSDEAMARAREQAEELRARILTGEDFAELARRFSADSASRNLGGDIGWFRRGGGLVEEFEDAAFSLRPGIVSPVVETMYGAHLIQIERVRGPERKIHHILIAAETDPEDAVRARASAEEAMERIRAGEPFRNFTGDQRSANLPDSISIEADRLGQFPSEYAAALSGASPGEMVGPVRFPTGQGDAWVVVRMLEVREAGEYSYEDVRSIIVERLQEEKFRERLLTNLRARTHVEIRL